MNIVKLQNELKGVPDEALIGYVQNPTGQVPTYLALSELQRRKAMRDKYQQQKTPEKTVAENLVQESQPQPQAMPQGVAGLPVPDHMFEEKSMASGGIVAFDDGGEVKHYAGLDGSYVYGSDAPYNPYTSTAPDQDIAGKVEQGYKDAVALILKKSQQGIPLTMDEKNLLQSRGVVNAMTGPTAATAIPLPGTGKIQPQPAAQTVATNVSPNLPPAANAAPAKPGASDLGIGGLYQPLKDYSSDYAALYQDPKGAAEAAMERYKTMIGTDTMRPQLEEKLKKMEERSAKQEQQAPWMALARAGLGMAAGKSQFALQNIAEGATMGLKDYNDAKDKLETAREKQFELQARMSQAQRAEQIAAATHGLQSEEHIKAQNQANKLAELGYKANREAANQKNKIDAFEAVNKGKYYSALGEASSNKEENYKTLYDNYLQGKYFQANLPPGLSYAKFKEKIAGTPSASAGWGPLQVK